tara:strand:+ start:3039 stop:3332 length:294 start_codon:yes stop_codon:yes gene_type:complete
MMKVPTIKHRVSIVCNDGTFATGFLHVPQGLRLLDYVNDTKERFIAITDAKFSNIKEIHSFKLYAEYRKSKEVIILNKTSIKWVEELAKDAETTEEV